jgi:hypothetical protein
MMSGTGWFINGLSTVLVYQGGLGVAHETELNGTYAKTKRTIRWSDFPLPNPSILQTDVIAGQVDMLPAKRLQEIFIVSPRFLDR